MLICDLLSYTQLVNEPFRVTPNSETINAHLYWVRTRSFQVRIFIHAESGDLEEKWCFMRLFVTSWDKTSHMLQNIKWQKFAFFLKMSKYVHFLFSSKTKYLRKFLSIKLIFALFC